MNEYLFTPDHLRQGAAGCRDIGQNLLAKVCEWAADEIERLEGENADLRKRVLEHPLPCSGEKIPL